MLVNAYDTRTGQKLPQQVPERWFGHPTLGKNISPTPPTPREQSAGRKAGKPAPTETPAAGDDKE